MPNDTIDLVNAITTINIQGGVGESWWEIIGLDPGGTTGIVYITGPMETLTNTKISLVRNMHYAHAQIDCQSGNPEQDDSAHQ